VVGSRRLGAGFPVELKDWYFVPAAADFKGLNPPPVEAT